MRRLVLFVMFAGLTGVASATIWTLDNSGGLADFTSFGAALSGTEDGDTVLIAASSTSYGEIHLTKPLCLIGRGFFLSQNPHPYENNKSAIVGNIFLDPGSSGAKLIGLSGGYVYIYAGISGVLVKRCQLSAVALSGNDNTIIQNYLNTGGGAKVFHCTGSNNIIRNNYMNDDVVNVIAAQNIFENNIVSTGLIVTSSSFGNNIILNGAMTFINCDPYNCISNGDQCGTENNNQANVDMAVVFVESGTTDGQWVLADGSPAIAAGLGEIDCGIFGGPEPYVLSGIPDIPAITAIFVPGRANPTDGLDIKVTIKSFN